MIAGHVVTRNEVEGALDKAGFEPTDVRTDTGTWWRSKKTGRHLLVPDPYDEMYPEFILKDLRELAGKVGVTLP